MRKQLAVIGASVVGASLARACSGLCVALVAGRRPAHANRGADSYDSRVYALSPGSVAFLRSIGVWQAIPRERLTPVYAMRVHGDAARSSIEFDAYRAGVAELAWIVEDGELQSALWRGLETQDGLELIVPGRCTALELGDAARVKLSDGRLVEADLVVGADGADSFVRQAAGIEAFESAYGQTAVVANFSCERPHNNVARQWFSGGPVLALLPLPGDRVSMVWSLPDARAERVLQLDERELASEVEAACGGALGGFERISPLQSYPLRRLAAGRLVAPRLALAGDAAHVVHPLAGQGLNLGLQDASALGAILKGREPVRGCADARLLRRYERERSEAILAMRATVHGLHSLFGARGEAARRARNLGLNLTDRLPVIKNILLRHALR